MLGWGGWWPVQIIGFFRIFRLELELRVRIFSLLGQGIGDLDSGLTIITANTGSL